MTGFEPRQGGGASNGRILFLGVVIGALCTAALCGGVSVLALYRLRPAPVVVEPPSPVVVVDTGQPEEVSDQPGEVADQPKASLGDKARPAFRDLVMAPDISASGLTELAAPENWDQKLYTQVVRYEGLYASAWKYWETIDSRGHDYAYVVGELRKAGLPDVLAAIPYQESRYTSDSTAPTCAAGYWQLMPETALRGGLGVSGCKLLGSDELWTPSQQVVPPRTERVYVDSDAMRCRIVSCAVDERRDLQRSTLGAIRLLSEAYNDPQLRASGAVVQLTIASYDAGYDDSALRRARADPHQILPAYRAWLQASAVDHAPDFIGQNLTCTSRADPLDFCGGALSSETQNYVGAVIAQHLLAACYYGANYGDLPEFAAYRSSVDEWCAHVNIPTRDQVASRRQPSPTPGR